MKDLIASTISGFLHWGERAATACNPSIPLESRGEVCKEIFKDSPAFWEAVAQMIAPQPKPIHLTPEGDLMSETKPAPTMPAEESAREVEMKKPPKKKGVTRKTRPVNNTMAEQLREPAKKLGLKDRSLIEQFRDHLSEKGKGTDYWRTCRDLTREALATGAIKDVSDWEILAVKISWNIFFTDQKTTTPFIDGCPKEVLIDLLLAERDGLWRQVDKIRQETNLNPNSPERIRFVIDCCLAVGEEASELLENCKHAVNRMKQKGLINAKHWLVQKVARMGRSKRSTETDEPEGTTLVDDERVDQVQEMAEAAIDATETEEVPEQTPQAEPVAEEESAPAEEPVVEAEKSTESVPANGDGKPDELDPAFARSFEEQMSNGGEEEVDPDNLPTEELERLTVPDDVGVALVY